MGVLSDLNVSNSTAIEKVAGLVATVVDSKFAELYKSAQALGGASGATGAPPPPAEEEFPVTGAGGDATGVTPGDMAILAGKSAALASIATGGQTTVSKTAEGTQTLAKT